METWHVNLYYEPEKLGLVPVAEVELCGDDYSFDLRVVWKHVDTGVVYTARDSGCSCPTPFEDYVSLEHLDQLNPHTVRTELESELLGSSYVTAAERLDFLRKVQAALR